MAKLTVAPYVVLALLCMACCFGDLANPGGAPLPPPPPGIVPGLAPPGLGAPGGASCDVRGPTHTCTHRSAAEIPIMGTADILEMCTQYSGTFDGTHGCNPIGAMGSCRYPSGTVEVLYLDGPNGQDVPTFSGFCTTLGGQYTPGPPPP